MEEISLLAKPVEKRLIGARHEALRPKSFKRFEQSRPPLRVKMGRNFVKKKDGSAAAFLFHRRSLRQDQPDQQRLLFAGRAERRRHGFGRVGYQKITPVRA